MKFTEAKLEEDLITKLAEQNYSNTTGDGVEEILETLRYSQIFQI